MGMDATRSIIGANEHFPLIPYTLLPSTAALRAHCCIAAWVRAEHSVFGGYIERPGRIL